MTEVSIFCTSLFLVMWVTSLALWRSSASGPHPMPCLGCSHWRTPVDTSLSTLLAAEPQRKQSWTGSSPRNLQNASVNGSEWVPCFALKLPLIAVMLLEFLLEARGQYLNSSKKKKTPTLIACSGHFAAKITSFACSIYDWETTTAVCCAWVTQRWGDTESIRNAA